MRADFSEDKVKNLQVIHHPGYGQDQQRHLHGAESNTVPAALGLCEESAWGGRKMGFWRNSLQNGPSIRNTFHRLTRVRRGEGEAEGGYRWVFFLEYEIKKSLYAFKTKNRYKPTCCFVWIWMHLLADDVPFPERSELKQWIEGRLKWSLLLLFTIAVTTVVTSWRQKQSCKSNS